jgi:hypothetical protein
VASTISLQGPLRQGNKQDSEQLEKAISGGRPVLCCWISICLQQAREGRLWEDQVVSGSSAALTCELWRSHGHLLSADTHHLRWKVGNRCVRKWSNVDRWVWDISDQDQPSQAANLLSWILISIRNRFQYHRGDFSLCLEGIWMGFSPGREPASWELNS